jgi:hypothetical protein
MNEKPRIHKCKAEQERRPRQAVCRAEEVRSSSSSRLREAERAPREAIYKAEVLKWRIEGAALGHIGHAAPSSAS